MRTGVFVVVTAVLSILAGLRVGRWALAEPAHPLSASAQPAPATTTSTTEPAFLTGPVVRFRLAPPTPTTVDTGRGWTWDQLATCESRNRWDVVRSVYQGGLQFDARTWDHYVTAFPRFPADAHVATREQQIAVAERVLAREGPKAWPTCGPRIGMTGDAAGAGGYPAGPPLYEPD
jgi:hypothetical protein